MDATKVEAMLQEAKVNRSDSRALFRHLNQFFCASFFESEKKRRETFAGQEFAPVQDVYTLPDKTRIEYWYKMPHALLQHSACFILSREVLTDVSGVDITIGGDHGKGRFRVMLKLIVRYSSDKSPFYEMFQV